MFRWEAWFWLNSDKIEKIDINLDFGRDFFIGKMAVVSQNTSVGILTKEQICAIVYGFPEGKQSTFTTRKGAKYKGVHDVAVHIRQGLRHHDVDHI